MFRPYPKMKDSGVEWLGVVPAHWGIKPLKHVVNLINEKAESTDGKYIGLENIESFTGRLIPSSSEVEQEGIANLFMAADVLFGKLRPYLAKAIIAKVNGRCSSELLVLRPLGTIPSFLHYQVLSDHFIRIVDSSTYGTKMPRANWDFIGKMPVPVPNLAEQRAIASFLDRKAALIDDLIAKRERQIELLQEQQTALISRAVTKGLNPDVPMKDSGVEWLGEIPMHWDLRSNRALFQERIESGVPGLPVLKVSLHSGVTEGVDDDEDSSRVRKIMDDKTSYKRAYAGDIAYNMMRAWQGAIGAVPVDGLVSPAYVVARPAEGVESRYFEGLFRTSWYTKDFERYSYGIASFRWRLYWDQFKVLRSPVPPINEQRAIADYIDCETAKIDTFVSKVQQSIEKLREYRQSLISAAVTGKIDLRNRQSVLVKERTQGDTSSDESVRTVIDLVRVALPKVHCIPEGNGYRFPALTGKGVEVLVTPTAVEIRLPTVVWMKGAYDPRATTRLWAAVGHRDLLAMGEHTAGKELRRLIQVARQDRAAEFRICRFCGCSVPEEHRHSQDVCHGCAEKHLGVAH